MVLTLALTCVLSPGERILPITLPVIRLTVRQIQSREVQGDGERFSFSVLAPRMAVAKRQLRTSVLIGVASRKIRTLVECARPA